MAIELSITKGSGGFRGTKTSLGSYSAQENITPLDGTLGNPGAGTLSFGVTESAKTAFLMDNAIELKDGARGRITGTVRALSASDLGVSVTADSKTQLFVATKTANPFYGTLRNALTYYMGLINITGGFQVEEEIAYRIVTLPGWRQDLFTAISNLCVAQQIEATVVYDNIVFRRPRQNIAVTSRKKSSSWSIDRGSPALAVEAYYYQSKQITNGLVYPSPLENSRDGYTVSVNEDLEPTRIQMSASLTTVNQPAPTTYLPPNYTGGSGYVVIGQDDLPIPSDEWTSKGGYVKASIDPNDPGVLILNIHGMNEPSDSPDAANPSGRAPYRVGVISSGDGTYYPAMYITGTGVSYDKQKITVSTGATNTELEVGATIDNSAIQTIGQAATAAEKAARRLSGLNYSISGDAVSLNRRGSGNEFATSKLSAFDSEFSGQKLSALDARGWDFIDFDQHYADLVINQFENQLFGNASGSRIPQDDAWFRIDSATTTQESVSYNATPDTLMDDWNTVWSGQKLAAWDAEWTGLKLRDWDIRPLRRSA